jgi:hypothetical protein
MLVLLLYHCFYCYSLKKGIAIPPALLFLLSIALASHCRLFPNELHGRFFNLSDECHWDDDGN